MFRFHLCEMLPPSQYWSSAISCRQVQNGGKSEAPDTFVSNEEHGQVAFSLQSFIGPLRSTTALVGLLLRHSQLSMTLVCTLVSKQAAVMTLADSAE